MDVGSNEFAVIFNTQPEAESTFKFWDFVKVFIFGDIVHMMEFSSYGYGRQVSSVLEPALQDEERRERYLGDPVKTAMLVQALRRFPYVVAIPAVVSIVLMIVSLSKLAIPFIRRMTVVADYLAAPARKKREAIALDGLKYIPTHLKKIGECLSRAVDAIEFLALEELDKHEGLRKPAKRSARLMDYHERKARYHISEVTNVGKYIKQILRTWLRILPDIGNCVGAVVGCQVRFSYWGTACKPWVLMTACMTLMGRSVGGVLQESYAFFK